MKKIFLFKLNAHNHYNHASNHSCYVYTARKKMMKLCLSPLQNRKYAKCCTRDLQTLHLLSRQQGLHCTSSAVLELMGAKTSIATTITRRVISSVQSQFEITLIFKIVKFFHIWAFKQVLESLIFRAILILVTCTHETILTLCSSLSMASQVHI